MYKVIYVDEGLSQLADRDTGRILLEVEADTDEERITIYQYDKLVVGVCVQTRQRTEDVVEMTLKHDEIVIRTPFDEVYYDYT